MVGHHGRGKGIASWGNEDTGELGEEEVWVCRDGIVETRLAEWEEGRVLLWSWLDWRNKCQLRIDLELWVVIRSALLCRREARRSNLGIIALVGDRHYRWKSVSPTETGI